MSKLADNLQAMNTDFSIRFNTSSKFVDQHTHQEFLYRQG